MAFAPKRSPQVYVIAGPNGAGKTTFAREFLPQYTQCQNFVNADMIAQGLSPFAPELAAFKAGRMMLDEIGAFASKRADFGFETTLSGKAHLRLLRELCDQGYRLNLYFLWIPSSVMSLSRVRARVLRGGHDIPVEVIRRRFERSIKNFLNDYRKMADTWIIFNNSGSTPEPIASQVGIELRIMDDKSYARLISKYGRPDEQNE